MSYANVDEVLADMTKVYQKLNGDAEFKEILKNVGEMRFHIFYTDLKAWISQVIEDGEISLHKGQVGEPIITEQISSETFAQIFSGELEPPEAAMSGKVNFDGDFSKVLMLQPMLPYTIKAYLEVQEEKKKAN